MGAQQALASAMLAPAGFCQIAIQQLNKAQTKAPTMNTPQRAFWNGQPERLRELFTLTKPSGARASCELHSHILFGFEIKLTVDGGLVRSKVLRHPEEIQTIADE